MKACIVCWRPIDEHTLAETRRCLETIETAESQLYCRLTGPKKVAA